MAKTPNQLATDCWKYLRRDRPTLRRFEAYYNGDQDIPHLVDSEDPECVQNGKASILNMMRMLVGLPAGMLTVEGVRPGPDRGLSMDSSPEWKHWQRSEMDFFQKSVYRGAFTYGHAFVVTEIERGRATSRLLSPLNTSAVYVDPVNDLVPAAALHVINEPTSKTGGRAYLWTDTHRYDVILPKTSTKLQNCRVDGDGVEHGATRCPVTRFAASLDVNGRTRGIVEMAMQPQDFLNLTRYHLLEASTNSHTPVRTITGVKFQTVNDPITGKPVVDERTGQVKKRPLRIRARDVLQAEDKEARFGLLSASPLDGHIKVVEMAMEQLAASLQAPGSATTGKMANLSGEALTEARRAETLKVDEFALLFGVSWKSVFRVAAELSGDEEGADDYETRIVWRNNSGIAFGALVDGLVKLVVAGLPIEGIVDMVPVTETQREEWRTMLRDAPSQVEGDADTETTDALAAARSSAAERRAARLSGQSVA